MRTDANNTSAAQTKKPAHKAPEKNATGVFWTTGEGEKEKEAEVGEDGEVCSFVADIAAKQTTRSDPDCAIEAWASQETLAKMRAMAIAFGSEASLVRSFVKKVPQQLPIELLLHVSTACAALYTS